MSNYSVYEHIFPNGKRYIGITSTRPEKRWISGTGYANQPKIYNAIKYYGWNNIKHNIIIDNLTKEQANALEQYLISSFNTIDNGYNVSIGGENIGSCYLDEYILSMLRFAKEHDITYYLTDKNENSIDIVNLVDKDRNNRTASEMWNEASRAVTIKHKDFSTTNILEVSKFWWYILQYYLLWISIQMGENVDNWKEEIYEEMKYKYIFKDE